MLFFQCYGVLRDLSSFPTRRSSDLEARERTQFSVRVRVVDGAPFSFLTTHVPERIGITYSEAELATQDRKSTRLNSSHSQISYAVFCLKKKTQPPTPITSI